MKASLVQKAEESILKEPLVRRKLQCKLPSLGGCHGEIVDLITATITGVMGVESLITSLILCYYFSAKCK